MPGSVNPDKPEKHSGSPPFCDPSTGDKKVVKIVVEGDINLCKLDKCG